MSQVGQFNQLSASIDTLTTDDLNVVGPIGGNVDVIGGVGIVTIGNPGAGSITIETTGVIPSDFVTDSGTAVPSLGQINILGGLNINTAGATDTVTINLDDTVSISGAFTAGTTAGDIVNATGDIEATLGNIRTLDGTISAGNIENNANPSVINFNKDRAGGPVLTGDEIGNFLYNARDNGSVSRTAAAIVGTATGTIGATWVPGSIQFLTHPDSVAAIAARMEITENGEVEIFEPDAGNALTVNGVIAQDDISVGYAGSEWVQEQASVQTLNASQTTIASLTVPAGQMITIKAMVNGFISSFDDAIGGEILVTAFRSAAGNVTLVGAPNIIENTTSTASLNADVNVGTQSVRLRVTGVAAETWNWVTTYNYMYTIDNT